MMLYVCVRVFSDRGLPRAGGPCTPYIGSGLGFGLQGSYKFIPMTSLQFGAGWS